MSETAPAPGSQQPAQAAPSQAPAEDKKEAPPPTALPNADAAKQAEQVAVKAHAEVNEKAMPVRQYLEHTVVPVVMQGMQQLAKERPEDPVEYLAAYLIKHNPKKKQEGAS